MSWNRTEAGCMGYFQGLNGEPESANPFTDTKMSKLWAKGWTQAQSEK